MKKKYNPLLGESPPSLSRTRRWQTEVAATRVLRRRRDNKVESTQTAGKSPISVGKCPRRRSRRIHDPKKKTSQDDHTQTFAPSRRNIEILTSLLPKHHELDEDNQANYPCVGHKWKDKLVHLTLSLDPTLFIYGNCTTTTPYDSYRSTYFAQSTPNVTTSIHKLYQICIVYSQKSKIFNPT